MVVAVAVAVVAVALVAVARAGGGGWEVGIFGAARGFGKGLTSSRTPGQGPMGAEPSAVGPGWARAPTTLFIFALLPP